MTAFIEPIALPVACMTRGGQSAMAQADVTKDYPADPILWIVDFFTGGNPDPRAPLGSHSRRGGYEIRCQTEYLIRELARPVAKVPRPSNHNVPCARSRPCRPSRFVHTGKSTG